MCGGSILSCCPCNPHGHERALKEEEEDYLCALHPLIKTTELQEKNQCRSAKKTITIKTTELQKKNRCRSMKITITNICYEYV